MVSPWVDARTCHETLLYCIVSGPESLPLSFVAPCAYRLPSTHMHREDKRHASKHAQVQGPAFRFEMLPVNPMFLTGSQGYVTRHPLELGWLRPFRILIICVGAFGLLATPTFATRAFPIPGAMPCHILHTHVHMNARARAQTVFCTYHLFGSDFSYTGPRPYGSSHT